MKIGIVGLGLMGGSLALSLRKLSFVSNIYGLDHNTEHQKEALRLKLVEKIIGFDELCTLDLIILAIPVNGIIKSLQALEGKISETTTIIDLGSTKEVIVKAVPPSIRKNFVAAHPMTGTEHSGPGAAFADLYNDQVVVLCDLEDSGTLQQETAVRIFSGIHMRLSYMHAHEHDRHAAFISHMPHVISYSIANSVLSQEDRYNILAMAAGGFRSMSRLAKSSPDMWEDIFKQNKANLLDAIETFQNELEEFKKEIKNDAWQEVREKMLKGNKLDEIFS
ncbi:prephenate dehydrogenase [Sulfurimonas sp. HSL3-7]|uniref:prephenate dehydrogenase n=1 Tax=Sulfonitrofixus jiaomeiensis TaxID=3131938 RepID=UPI0031F8510A